MNLLNQKNLIIIVSATIVLGVGTYFYQQACDQKEQSAKSALYLIQKTTETETAALTEAEKAPGAKFDVDVKLPKTVAELNNIIASKTTPEREIYEASLKLGMLYSEHSADTALDKAIATLKKVSAYGKSNFQKATALYLLGSAQERASLPKDAADSFQKALNENNEGLKEELLLSLVRVSLKSNNAVQAKAFADKLNKEAPGTRAAQEAQKLISKT